MSYYSERELKAYETLCAAIALPLPETKDDLGCEGTFDPWEIYPAFYGSYSSAFDNMALLVLRNLRDGSCDDEELAHEMFREFLCVQGLCNYGTSPRVCFPTSDFQNVLPALILKWEAYYAVRWGETA